MAGQWSVANIYICSVMLSINGQMASEVSNEAVSWYTIEALEDEQVQYSVLLQCVRCYCSIKPALMIGQQDQQDEGRLQLCATSCMLRQF